MIQCRDIFEYDLKSYFDLINLDHISAELLKRGVPPQIARMLYFINTCAVTLPKKVRMNEFEHMMKGLLHKDATPDEIINHPRPLSYMYRVRGVPQGAPTSPFLGNIALDGPILSRGLDAIQYADDGLYYGDFTEGYEYRMRAEQDLKASSDLYAANYNGTDRTIEISVDDRINRLNQVWDPSLPQEAYKAEVDKIKASAFMQIPADPKELDPIYVIVDGRVMMEKVAVKTPIITPNSGMVTANIHFNLGKSGWVKKDGI